MKIQLDLFSNIGTKKRKGNILLYFVIEITSEYEYTTSNFACENFGHLHGLQAFVFAFLSEKNLFRVRCVDAPQFTLDKP